MQDFAGNVKVFKYKTIDAIELTMNMYHPQGWSPQDRRPAVVFFFGGGWRGGNIDQFRPHCEYIAGKGMVAFTADYRVQSRHGSNPFDSVEDGKSALQWLVENADELGIDASRIAASGGSAGGHVALCTAVFKDPRQCAAPGALILFNPVTDTTETGFGKDIIGDRYRELSCTHHVVAGLPPTIIFHGMADTTVPYSNAEQFFRRMRDKGNRCELIAFADESHGFFNFGRNGNTSYKRTLALLISFLEEAGYLPVGL
jgi:acetyl esterase/lipase